MQNSRQISHSSEYFSLASCPRKVLLGTRKSSRLASRPEVHALALAIARKAVLRDDLPLASSALGGCGMQGKVASAQPLAAAGGDFGSPPRRVTVCATSTSSVNRRIIELSASCGVLLSETEASSLACFLRSAATEV